MNLKGTVRLQADMIIAFPLGSHPTGRKAGMELREIFDKDVKEKLDLYNNLSKIIFLKNIFFKSKKKTAFNQGK